MPAIPGVRVEKREMVLLLQVRFDPGETRVLLAHPKWSRLISTADSEHNGHEANNRTGKASLTKSQLRQVLSVLGMSRHDADEFLASEARRLTREGAAP